MATGLFGKLPAAGDFFALDLAAGLRPMLDRWITAHIAPLVGNPRVWPEGGVRGVLGSAKGPFILLIEPSMDSVGRAYPLVACVSRHGAGRSEADQWADAVWPILIAATEEGAPLEDLRRALSCIRDPRDSDAPVIPPALWWSGTAADRPERQMERLAALSSG